LLLKLITKISYYEEIISQKINYINKEYKYNKKETMNQIREISNESNKLNIKIEKLKQKEKDLLIRIENINQNSKTNLNIQKKLKDRYQEKLETLQIFLKDFEDEIFLIKEGLLSKVNEYTTQIENFQKSNKNLETLLIKKDQLEQNQDNYKGDLLKKRLQIAEKYRSIKEYMKKMNESGTQKSNLINSYIYKINEVKFAKKRL
jgi:hypothetical protein